MPNDLQKNEKVAFKSGEETARRSFTFTTVAQSLRPKICLQLNAKRMSPVHARHLSLMADCKA